MECAWLSPISASSRCSPNVNKLNTPVTAATVRLDVHYFLPLELQREVA